MARNFALGDELDLAIGSMTVAAPFTLAAIVRRTATTGNGYNDVIVGHNSGGGTGTFRGWDVGFNPAVANKMYVYTASGVGVEDGPALAIADGWAIAVWSKASGTVTPRYHLYKFAAPGWTHANGASTLVDGTAPAAGGMIKLGRFEVDTAGTMTGDIAAAAGWTRVLTDAEVENLVGSFVDWLDLSPAFCVALDQSAITQKVVDYSNISNESGRTGTTVSTTSVPGFNLDEGVWVPTIVKPAAGGTVTPTGLASAGAFGAVTIIPGGVSVSMTGLSSAGAFGAPTMLPGGVIVSVSGLGSAAQFGSATAEDMLIPVNGVPSAAQFGTVTASVPGGDTFSPAIQGGHYH